jgi:hypothetical protein
MNLLKLAWSRYEEWGSAPFKPWRVPIAVFILVFPVAVVLQLVANLIVGLLQ